MAVWPDTLKGRKGKVGELTILFIMLEAACDLSHGMHILKNKWKLQKGYGGGFR
jgi:hypothetical protein